MHKLTGLLFLFFAALCMCRMAIADLAFSPDGTDLFAGEYVDDVVDDRITIARTTGLSAFRFFGESLGTSIHVSENGNISTVPNSHFFPHAHNDLGVSTKLVAPLWDDVLMVNPTTFPTSAPKNFVREYKQAGLYAVTWQNVRLFQETVAGGIFPDTVRSAQVALIGTAQTLKGFAFKPNDIVFSYQSFNGTTKDFVDPTQEATIPANTFLLNAFVGLADTSAGTGAAGKYSHVVVDGLDIDTNNSDYVESPEAAGDGTGGRLPWTNQEFILFRELLDTDGEFAGYDVSIERFTAVPEPSSVHFGILAILACIGLRRRPYS